MFKLARLKLGVSQTRFAKLLGIPKTTYHYYENGKRKPSKEKEKEIKLKIKEINRRLDALNYDPGKSLICLFNILIFITILLFLSTFN